jgi:hypothetical protein
VALTTITCPCLKVFSKAALSAFVEKLLAYEIIPATERELYEKDAASIADAARRREVKLKQWKQEKELVTQIEVSHLFAVLDRYAHSGSRNYRRNEGKGRPY